MTDNHLIKDERRKAELVVAAKFADLELLHQFGNKIALYDAVALSNQSQVGLPGWVVKSIQSAIRKDWGGRLTK